MAQRLESSGMDRAQAYAVIEEMGNAIEKFAVTPEVLRRELEANNKVIFQRMDERLRQTDKRIDRLESLMKLGMGWLFALQLALLGLVGTLAV
ncbi:MAG: hypothetical protein F4229_06375 [Gammaproteobacteria bacterium]|nr:hypothetical protein [Gammaproteobacteria bacterium]MYH15073.1 hypothetical protein [Gammaproteobacteria bacterium]MYK83954.1 hypothetical protein [Gammaproteobacteria bacterium]